VSRRLLIGSAVVLVIFAAAGSFELHRLRRIRQQPWTLSGTRLTAFASLDPIDAHVHAFENSPELIQTLQRLRVRVLDILYVDDQNSYLKAIEAERMGARDFISSSQGHALLCTTFDPFRFYRARSPKQTIDELNNDFAHGAVAAKIWKNIGMEIRDASGKYIMPDDPRLEPVYKDITAQGKTLIIHAADPADAWGRKNPWGLVVKYYETNPQWNMAIKSGAPQKEEILNAVDRVLAAHPDMRVIGAHFASTEDHLEGLAERLDRYPNFAIDTAARIRRVAVQPRDQVRDFFLKYQDRILYGTDVHFFPGDDASSTARSWENEYALDWRYFSTDDTFQYRDQAIRGLKLPIPVLKKIYHDNAVRWLPGIK
jgi:predicted TIM-barrel fold metal-dependent hydrolase